MRKCTLLYVLMSLTLVYVFVHVFYSSNATRYFSISSATGEVKQDQPSLVLKQDEPSFVLKPEKQILEEPLPILTEARKETMRPPTTKRPVRAPTTPKPPVKLACPYVNVDPFDPVNWATIKIDRISLDCSKGLPGLVYFKGDRIYVNATKVSRTVGNIDYCRYGRIELSDINDRLVRDPVWSRKFLDDSIEMSSKDENIVVECYLNKTIVGETYKARVVDKSEKEKKYEVEFQRHLNENSPVESLNLLMLGVDGTSKQNFMRTMPKTREYILNNLNAKEFHKLNKVGDNTFPNLLAFLAGKNERDIARIWNKDRTFFDDIDKIFSWHHYQKAGYHTSVVFDVTHIAPFHHIKRGWKRPPFDYNTRALSLQIVKNTKRIRTQRHNCIADVPEVSIFHDYLLQLTTKFNNTKTKPYFAFTFLTRLTHDNGSHAAFGDYLYLKFFQQLVQKKLLNNTILIFFSDHGRRYGTFRQTFNGQVENNTPFMYWMFPQWFEKKYPDLMETFTINQNRLTTFFDAYQTLMDLLKFKGKTKRGNLHSRGISLFDEIPPERTCSHADIPMQFCNCKSILAKATASKELTETISKHLLDVIRSKSAGHRDMCALLDIQTVHAVVMVKSNKQGDRASYYQATIQTTPGSAMYEGLIRYNDESKQMSVVGEISRLNMYRGQDFCANTLDLKLFCFCTS